MAVVYVLSGRECLGNNEWGHGCVDVRAWNVYSDYESAKSAFDKKVLEIAEFLESTQDEFEYTEDTIFETKDANEGMYGWACYMEEEDCSWEVCIPEDDDFSYGFWFQPIVTLEKFEIK